MPNQELNLYETIQKIRIVNAVRAPYIGFPITFQQFEYFKLGWTFLVLKSSFNCWLKLVTLVSE